MKTTDNTIQLEPLRWYSISYLSKIFKINYYFLKEAVEENRLHTVSFGNAKKTTGAEYLRFINELLYDNKPTKKQTKHIKRYADLDNFTVFNLDKIEKSEIKRGIV